MSVPASGQLKHTMKQVNWSPILQIYVNPFSLLQVEKTRDRAAELNMYSVNLRCERPLRDFQKGNISKSKLAEIRLSRVVRAVEQMSKLGSVEEMQGLE